MFAVARSVSQWLERADRGSFRAWLLRITRNEAVDTISRRATRPLGRDGACGSTRAGRTAARDDISSRLDLEYERTVFRGPPIGSEPRLHHIRGRRSG